MRVKKAARKIVLRLPRRSPKKMHDRAPIKDPIWKDAMTAPLLIELCDLSGPVVLTVSSDGN